MKKVLVYGAHWCAECVAVKSWLTKHDIAFDYHDVDVEGRDGMHQYDKTNETIPLLVIDDEVLINPSYDILSSRLLSSKGKQVEKDTKIHDVVMVGAGPAALAAAVYTAREDIQTTIFEKGVIGGLAAITDKVDNYPGFQDGIEGLKLADNLRLQAERFGAVIELGEVNAVKKVGDVFKLDTTSGEMTAKTVLVATGSEWVKLGIPGEVEFYGRGVHNCATCDGAFYRDKRLVVVGGGNSAAQEALFLTRFASHIDILIRGEGWKASDVLVHEVEANKKLHVHFNTTTQEIVGVDGKVTKVVGKNTKTGKLHDFETDGVFVFVGLKPVTYFLKNTGVEFDDGGFIKTDLKLQTKVPGLFVAGDVRSGATMQIASAVGEGATAALSIREYIEAK
ncbi:thioredoxin reductase [bacterium]|nr:thioredoxin reductase [bacterium]NBX98143.1 thioredoxin reductase [bacterium]NDC94853.1 thioredoxin reductase [bacterium]NDD83368.1 thioredoxin reductase [bacterium]NDG28946.1 thioredoxin reductase [bacterium]